MYDRRDVPDPPPSRAMLNVLEAATLSGLGRNTIRKLIKTGQLKHRRVGKRIVIRRDDLMRFMDPANNQPASNQ